MKAMQLIPQWWLHRKTGKAMLSIWLTGSLTYKQKMVLQICKRWWFMFTQQWCVCSGMVLTNKTTTLLRPVQQSDHRQANPISTQFQPSFYKCKSLHKVSLSQVCISLLNVYVKEKQCPLNSHLYLFMFARFSLGDVHTRFHTDTWIHPWCLCNEHFMPVSMKATWRDVSRFCCCILKVWQFVCHTNLSRCTSYKHHRCLCISSERISPVAGRHPEYLTKLISHS